MSCDSLDLRRVLIAPRTRASLGKEDKDENTSLVVTIAAPVTLVEDVDVVAGFWISRPGIVTGTTIGISTVFVRPVIIPVIVVDAVVVSEFTVVGPEVVLVESVSVPGAGDVLAKATVVLNRPPVVA